MFENRLLYASELEKLGADIKAVTAKQLTWSARSTLQDEGEGTRHPIWSCNDPGGVSCRGLPKRMDVRHGNRGYADIVGTCPAGSFYPKEDDLSGVRAALHIPRYIKPML